MKRNLIVTIYSVLFTVFSNAQDPNFTMFYNNPTYYNPGMTAINNGLTFRTNNRFQWWKIPGQFNTLSASFEGKLSSRFATGMNLISDVAGEGLLRTTGVAISGAYSISNTSINPITNPSHKFQVGLSVGFMNRYIDWSKLSFSDQYDEVLGKVYPTNFVAPNFNSTFYSDLGLGAVYQFYLDRKTTKQFKKILLNIGGAMQHLNSPPDAFFEGKTYPIKTVIHAKTQILFGSLLYSFAGIYETQNKFSTRTLGFNIQHNSSVNVGLWSRSGNTINDQHLESFIFSISSIVSNKSNHNIRLSYSRDLTISGLGMNTHGTNEISIVFMIYDKYMFNSLKVKKLRKNMLECPKNFF